MRTDAALECDALILAPFRHHGFAPASSCHPRAGQVSRQISGMSANNW
jgi:hypothetical protein